ncbi:MAG: hypothetical protein OXF49_01775 [Candidatus Saccharibacteria bacterium]|nr:hypothetical protein [Candidatus Saccharibacteria bacterium]
MSVSNSKSSKLFNLVIIVLLGFIAYGIYVYVQDHTLENTSKEIQESTPTTESLEADSTSLVEANERYSTIEDLPRLTAENLKTNTSTIESSTEQFIAFTTVNHNLNDQTADIGIIFTLDQRDLVAHNCRLTIEDSKMQIATATATVVTQQGRTGCKFKQLDLSSLADLEISNNNFWLVTSTVQTLNNQELLKLTKRITSLESLIKIED